MAFGTENYYILLGALDIKLATTHRKVQSAQGFNMGNTIWEANNGTEFENKPAEEIYRGYNDEALSNTQIKAESSDLERAWNFRNAFEKRIKDLGPLASEAKVHALTGDFDLAIKYLEEAIVKIPDLNSVKWAYSSCGIDSNKDLEDANKWQEEISQCYFKRGERSYKSNNHAEAFWDFRMAQAWFPADKDIWLHLQNYLGELEQLAEQGNMEALGALLDAFSASEIKVTVEARFDWDRDWIDYWNSYANLRNVLTVKRLKTMAEYPEPLRLCKKYAGEGRPEAQFYLGKINWAQSYEQRISWYKKSAESNYKPAKDALLNMKVEEEKKEEDSIWHYARTKILLGTVVGAGIVAAAISFLFKAYGGEPALSYIIAGAAFLVTVILTFVTTSQKA